MKKSTNKQTKPAESVRNKKSGVRGINASEMQKRGWEVGWGVMFYDHYHSIHLSKPDALKTMEFAKHIPSLARLLNARLVPVLIVPQIPQPQSPVSSNKPPKRIGKKGR